MADKAAEDTRRDTEVKQRQQQHKLRYYERQFDVYLELCDVTSKIAVASKVSQVEKEIERFHELLIGRLALVTDKAVADAAVDFHTQVIKIRGNPDAVIPRKLQSLAYAISLAARDQLKLAFPDVDVPDLGNFGAKVGAMKR